MFKFEKTHEQSDFTENTLCKRRKVPFRLNMRHFSPFLEQNVHHIWERAYMHAQESINHYYYYDYHYHYHYHYYCYRPILLYIIVIALYPIIIALYIINM